MKKLTLSVDALRVESFQPAAAQTETGTVQGHQAAAGTYLMQCFYTEQASCTC